MCRSLVSERRKGSQSHSKDELANGIKSEATVFGAWRLPLAFLRKESSEILKGLDAEGGYEASWTATANCKEMGSNCFTLGTFIRSVGLNQANIS